MNIRQVSPSPQIAWPTVRNSPDVVAAGTADIYQSMLRESLAISEPNFQLIENYCYTLDYDKYYPFPQE